MQGMVGTPRIPRGYVTRPRLIDRIGRESALVVVHGPAGFGKTVAVSDWASTVPGAWCTVSRSASSRVGFWAELAEHLTDTGVAPPDSILALGGLVGLAAEPDPLRLIVRAFAQLSGELTIVLDDFSLATDPIIRDDLVALLQANRRLAIVVITRRAADFDSPAIRLALDPVFIGTDELRLTRDEVAQLIAASSVADPDGVLADALLGAVDGSVLLTRGVVQAIARGDHAFEAGSLLETVSRLGSTLLRQLVLEHDATDEWLHAVACCSVPTVLTRELVHELTGGDGDAVLAVFDSEGFGIWIDTHHGPTFALSPLVRSAFRAELDARWSDELPALSRIAAVWSSRFGDAVTALEHAVTANDLDLATGIMLSHWQVFLYGQSRELIALLNDLPLRTLAKHPVLAMVLALSHNATGINNRIRAVELFAVASTGARLGRAKATPPMRVILLLVESASLRVAGRGKAALEVAEQARELVDELTQDQRDLLGTMLPTILNQAGLTFFYGGAATQALGLFQAAIGRTSDPRDRGAFHALSLLAGVHAVRGNMVDAAHTVERIRAGAWPEAFASRYPGCLLHVAEATLAIERGDFAAALDHIAETAPHRPTIEHWPLLVGTEAIAMLGMGQAHAALASIEAEVATHEPMTTPVGAQAIALARSLVQLALGSVVAAESALQGLAAKQLLIATSRARLELLRDRPESANRVLHAAVVNPDGPVRWHSELLLLRAATALRLGHCATALEAAEVAVALMGEHGLRLPLLLLPQCDADALRVALAERGGGPAHDLFQECADRPSLLPDSIPVVSLSEREAVVLRALASTDSVSEIAQELFVSKNTVKSQLRSLYRKLGAASRDEALLAAGELDLFR